MQKTVLFIFSVTCLINGKADAICQPEKGKDQDSCEHMGCIWIYIDEESTHGTCTIQPNPEELPNPLEKSRMKKEDGNPASKVTSRNISKSGGSGNNSAKDSWNKATAAAFRNGQFTATELKAALVAAIKLKAATATAIKPKVAPATAIKPKAAVASAIEPEAAAATAIKPEAATATTTKPIASGSRPNINKISPAARMETNSSESMPGLSNLLGSNISSLTAALNGANDGGALQHDLRALEPLTKRASSSALVYLALTLPLLILLCY